MADYTVHNALLQICRAVNQQCKQIDSRDLTALTEILQREYRRIEPLFPGITYFKFKYILGQLNGQFPERD